MCGAIHRGRLLQEPLSLARVGREPTHTNGLLQIISPQQGLLVGTCAWRLLGCLSAIRQPPINASSDQSHNHKGFSVATVVFNRVVPGNAALDLRLGHRSARATIIFRASRHGSLFIHHLRRVTGHQNFGFLARTIHGTANVF